MSADRTGWGLLQSPAVMLAVFVGVEVTKQVVTYGTRLVNGGQYPLSPSMMVVAVEVIKWVAALVMQSREAAAVDAVAPVLRPRVNLWFSIPAAVYFVNNLLYFVVLEFCSPPLWMLLLQLRVVITAFMYTALPDTELFRPVKTRLDTLQWLSLPLLMAGVAFAQLDQGDLATKNLSVAVLLALLVSSLSSAIGIYTQFLFTWKELAAFSFWDRQVQLYAWGTAAGMTWWLGRRLLGYSPEAGALLLFGNGTSAGTVLLLLAASLLLNAALGISVAQIMKYLGNLPKLFAMGLSVILTGVLSGLLFPEAFTFSINFLVGALVVIGSLFLYNWKAFSK